jgi:hypothetical protein
MGGEGLPWGLISGVAISGCEVSLLHDDAQEMDGLLIYREPV